MPLIHMAQWLQHRGGATWKIFERNYMNEKLWMNIILSWPKISFWVSVLQKKPERTSGQPNNIEIPLGIVGSKQNRSKVRYSKIVDGLESWPNK